MKAKWRGVEKCSAGVSMGGLHGRNVLLASWREEGEEIPGT